MVQNKAFIDLRIDGTDSTSFLLKTSIHPDDAAYIGQYAMSLINRRNQEQRIEQADLKVDVKPQLNEEDKLEKGLERIGKKKR